MESLFTFVFVRLVFLLYCLVMKKCLSFLGKNAPVILTALFLISFCFVHLLLVSNTFYIGENGSFNSTSEGYGDIPLQLTQISKFAFSSDLNFYDPIFYGESLRYHFFLNLFRGLILAITGSWSVAVMWPLYLLVIGITALVFLIYRKILKDKFLALASFIIFFLGSGFGWIDVISGNFGTSVVRLDAVYPFQNVDFGAPLLLVLTHQHIFIFGLFLFLLCLYSVFLVLNGGGRKEMILATLVFGLLPLSHVHSFIALSALIAVILLWLLIKKNYLIFKKLFTVSIIASLLAIPQLIYLFAGKSLIGAEGSFTTFRFGWMLKEGIGGATFPSLERSFFSFPYMDFLWMNFGIILPLFVIGIIYLFVKYRRANELEKSDFGLIPVFAIGGLFLFIITQFIQFQPWDFDNNKILVYFLFLASPIIIWLVSKIFKNKLVIRNILVVCVVLFATLTGLLDLSDRVLVSKANLHTIFDINARDLAKYIDQNVKEDELVLTGTSHLNPVASLAGRSVLVGYPGWLWTRGIDYGERKSEIDRFYREPSIDAGILKEYPIAYILVDDLVKKEYAISLERFDQLFEREFEKGNYILYRVNNKRD
jgi:hypothetical protein